MGETQSIIYVSEQLKGRNKECEEGGEESGESCAHALILVSVTRKTIRLLRANEGEPTSR
jgi:hypothetical protein